MRKTGSAAKRSKPAATASVSPSTSHIQKALIAANTQKSSHTESSKVLPRNAKGDPWSVSRIFAFQMVSENSRVAPQVILMTCGRPLFSIRRQVPGNCLYAFVRPGSRRDDELIVAFETAREDDARDRPNGTCGRKVYEWLDIWRESGPRLGVGGKAAPAPLEKFIDPLAFAAHQGSNDKPIGDGRIDFPRPIGDREGRPQDVNKVGAQTPGVGKRSEIFDPLVGWGRRALHAIVARGCNAVGDRGGLIRIEPGGAKERRQQLGRREIDIDTRRFRDIINEEFRL